MTTTMSTNANTTNNTHHHTKEKKNHDRFLASMTFAFQGEACECDECEDGICEAVPAPISDAVREFQMKQLLENVVPSQERNLIARDINGSGGVSIWKLSMPPGSEPLVEFGNSYRMVLVDKIPEGRTIHSVGQGIIGSSDEEASRQKVSWKEKHAYVYKPNGGKALGWINERQEADKKMNISDTSNDVVIYMFKCTTDAIVDASSKENERLSEWASQVVTLFLGLDKHEEEEGNEKDDELIELQSAEYSILKDVLASQLK